MDITKKKGFTMIELLVVIAIIVVISTLAMVFLGGARDKARDTKRLAELSQIGRFLTFGCLVPAGGAGEYDLNELLSEFRVKYPQYADNIPKNIQDPKTGTAAASNYKYLVDSNGDCVLFANLELADTPVTIPGISQATPHGGKGVFQSSTTGWNNSTKYFQVSN